ncbi:helix-turn-helix domain-containing protein [Lentzea sp. E54]|uniref:helix-turn-helix domain-containing protein n=1 Tax=Lentzea xerophila TaxID=3435883 RepID=UPI003DA65AF6
MEHASSITVRRYLVGRRLRLLREQAGKTTTEAATFAYLKQPTITRIEKGRHAILERNVRRLCELYEVDAAGTEQLVSDALASDGTEWFAVYSETVPDWFEYFVAFESDAAEIRSYQAENVPGLLQVPDYIRGITSAGRSGVSSDELDRSVRFRVARQRRLELNPPTLHYVLNEAVIRRMVGGVDAMRGQLQHLIKMAEQDYLALQLLPFSAGAHPAQAGSFTMLRLPDEAEPNFVYLEHDHGAVYQEREQDLARYGAVFDQLTRLALSPEETVAALTSLVNEL